jgi:hypothetical protein
MVQPVPGSKLWVDAGMISEPTTVTQDHWVKAFGELDPDVWRCCQAVIAVSSPLKPCDMVLLHAFCRAAVLEQRTTQVLMRDPAGAPAPVLATYGAAVTALATLAMHLGLSPRAREQRRSPGRPPKPKPVAAPGEQTS